MMEARQQCDYINIINTLPAPRIPRTDFIIHNPEILAEISKYFVSWVTKLHLKHSAPAPGNITLQNMFSDVSIEFSN